MNSRFFFKKVGLLVGTALISPKVLFKSESALKPYDDTIINQAGGKGKWNFTEGDALVDKAWAKCWWTEAKINLAFYKEVK